MKNILKTTVAVVASVGMIACAKPAPTVEASTSTVQQGDLSISVVTLGTIKAADQQDIASSVGMPIESISAKVGDVVSQGQTLAKLDCSSLQNDYATKSKAYFQAKEIYTNDVDLATLKFEQTVADNDIAVADAANAVENARRGCADTAAGGNLTTLEQTITREKTELGIVQSRKTSADATVTAAVKACELYTTLGGAPCGTAPDPTDLEATADYNKKKAAYESAVAAQTAAQGAVDAQNTVLQSATDAYNVAKTNWQSAYDNVNGQNCQAYCSAQEAYNKAVTNRERSNGDAWNAKWRVERNSTSIDAARIDLQETVKKMQQCTITAPISGTIMSSKAAINAVDNTISGALFSIATSQDLVMTGLVNELDSTRISVGMKCLVSSDALGTDTLTATLTSISPTAADAAGNFTVTASINGDPGKLAIGMTGKLKILLQESSNCYYVSGDSIGMDENGNSVVYVQNEKGGFDAVPVTVGLATDYYTEISGDGISADTVIADDPYSVTAG